MVKTRLYAIYNGLLTKEGLSDDENIACSYNICGNIPLISFF